MNLVELIPALLGFLFTLMILSYIIGDNPLFRFAVSIFVGVSAGFAGAVALRSIVYPNVIWPLIRVALGNGSAQDAYAVIPLLLSVLLLLKLSKRLGRAGNIAMAYLVGIGAAVAVGGAILGTIFPQAGASMDLLDFSSLPGFQFAPADFATEVLSRFIALVGTLATLIYFHFGVRAVAGEENLERSKWLEVIGQVGQGFIAVTFGVMFAGVYSASLMALIDRVAGIVDFFLLFFSA